MNITDNFLNELDKVYNATVPPAVLAKAKRSLQDYLCVALAGANAQAENIVNAATEQAERALADAKAR